MDREAWQATFHQFSSIQSLILVWLRVTPWTAACQTPLSITNCRRLLKLMSIESVMPSNHLILCHPLLLLPSIFTSIRVFSNESALHIRWPKYWISASASVLPVSIQGWFPLGLTGLILQSTGFSIVFSSTTVWKHRFFCALPSLWSNSHVCTWLLEKTIVLTIWTFVGKVNIGQHSLQPVCWHDGYKDRMTKVMELEAIYGPRADPTTRLV